MLKNKNMKKNKKLLKVFVYQFFNLWEVDSLVVLQAVMPQHLKLLMKVQKLKKSIKRFIIFFGQCNIYLYYQFLNTQKQMKFEEDVNKNEKIKKTKITYSK